MEKDKLLDIIDKTQVVTNNTLNKFLPLLFVICCLLLLSGCALPRIIVFEDPLTPEEHLNLGVAYETKGEFDPAIKEYKLAAKTLPLAYLYLGNVYFQKDEFDEAEKNYRRAIKKDPQNADSYNNLAWLYNTKKERIDEAEGLVLEAIERNPSKGKNYRDTLEKIRELKKAVK